MRRPFKLLRRRSCRRTINTISSDPFDAYLSQSTTLSDPLPIRQTKIQGKRIALKDNICTTDGLPTSCASKMMQGYFSPFDATIVSLLKDAGAVITGKTNMDEFAMGSTSTNSPVSVKNPHRGKNGAKLCAGGSSGGSAAAVAAGLAWAAIGTDTGGSVRLPAAYCGIVGFKPTYGLISRYGVVSYAHSLDTVGIFSFDVKSSRSLFDVLNVYDQHDPTSLAPSIRAQFPTSFPRRWTFGVPREYNLPNLHPAMSRAWSVAIARLQSSGHSVEKVSLPRTREALSAYYVLATAEAASNLARYDGVRFGFNAGKDGYQENLSSSRAQGFGDEVRRRILLGNYSLSAGAFESHFIQAQKVRRLIQFSFDDVFKAENMLHRSRTRISSHRKCDILICPTTVGPAPELATISSLTPVETYVNDVFTVPGSLAGLPAINIPVQVDGHIVGLQLVGQVATDSLVLEAAKELETLLR